MQDKFISDCIERLRDPNKNPSGAGPWFTPALVAYRSAQASHIKIRIEVFVHKS